MSDPFSPPSTDGSLAPRLRALRDGIDWMMLFPVAAALAWFLGEAAVAMVLAVILPAFLALQGRSSRSAPQAAQRGDASISPQELSRQMHEILEEAAALDRRTAVLRLRLSPCGPEAWDTGTGDRLRTRITPRVMGAVRGQDRVFRTGIGDLVILLSPTRHADLPVLMTIVDRVQMAVAEPISIDGQRMHARSAIGVCSEQMAASRSARALLQGAEAALQAAMRERSEAVRFFDADLRAQVEVDAQLLREIDAALEGGQFGAFFQPQIEGATGHIAGFTAFARWMHPELGVLGPDRFLSAAQASGRMSELGEAVLGAALDALDAWEAAGLAKPSIRVTLSLEELADPRLAERMIWHVDQRDICPARLSLALPAEVAERAENVVMRSNIQSLREAGLRIDLDEFGTGPATVGDLARFGVHRIVLDRGLIAGREMDPGRRQIVAAILAMADVMGLVTLAEGVESAEVEAELARMGCAQLQGYAIARPMPLIDTLTWLRGRITVSQATRTECGGGEARLAASTDLKESGTPRRRWLQ